jgi:hypothetical protein
MDRKAERGRDREARIVALLFALADLAERAALRSAPVRWLVLWFLCQADAVAREHIAGYLSKPARGRLPAALCRGHGPEDAMNLAASLRALARLARRLAAHLWRLSLSGPAIASSGPAGGLRHVLQANPAFSPLQPLDTS